MSLQKIRITDIESQIKRFQARLKKLEKKSRNLGTVKAVIFLTGLAAFLGSYFYLTIVPVIVIIILFLLTFGILTKLHN
jgi:hypothetical protein